MVNRTNRIEGRGLDRHPLEGREDLGVWQKHGQVVAAQSQQGGVIATPEGEMTFQPGDYIVTDNPPTHAWPVHQDVFNSTYLLVAKLEADEAPRGKLPKKPKPKVRSIPPANAGQIKEAAKAAGVSVTEYVEQRRSSRRAASRLAR